jgi:hypothetical protein
VGGPRKRVATSGASGLMPLSRLARCLAQVSMNTWRHDLCARVVVVC